MKKFSIIILVLIGLSSLYSYTILDRYCGNMINNVDVRAAAMGGAATAGGNSLLDMNLNPANLAMLNQKYGFQANYSVLKFDDNRSLPMFNFFDNYVGDATYVSNVNFYDDFVLAGHFNYQMGSMIIGLGASHKPVVNFDCKYEEQIRTNTGSNNDAYPALLANNYMEGKGSLYATSGTFSLGYKLDNAILNSFSIGFEGGTMSGSNDQKREIIWTQAARDTASVALNDYFYSYKQDINSKTFFKMGIVAKLMERMAFGFSYAPKVEFDTDTKVDTVAIDNVKYILPSQIRIGFSYQPRNVIKTIFTADVAFNKNTDIADSLDNTVSYSVGIEHLVARAIPFRFGFRYETSLMDNTVGIPTYTAGTGFAVMKNVSLDISGEFSNRTYEALDLFMDSYYNKDGLWSGSSYEPEDRGWDKADTVNEKFVKLQASLTYKW